MAGFVFNMGQDRRTGVTGRQAVLECMAAGVYPTRSIHPLPSGKWRGEHLAVLGDFLTMRTGDHVYFLSGRNMYGIGQLVGIGGRQCALSNYPSACDPSTPAYEEVKDALLWDDGTVSSLGARWVCTFEPSPLFFSRGVDMDVALAARPESMRRLPSNQDRTFIKLDDEEDRVLSQLLLLENRDYFENPANPALSMVGPTVYRENHARIRERLSMDNYDLNLSGIRTAHRNGRRLTPEMALEVMLLDCLRQANSVEAELFGRIDYLAHQVPASPTKKFMWMDKMDIFGYAYAPETGLAGIDRPVVRYAVVELKPEVASVADVSQVMSYVDWVTHHWAGLDPSLVSAFLVAASFPDEVRAAAKTDGLRYYTVGRREESKTRQWSELRLVSYTCDRTDNSLRFTNVT